MCTHWRVVVCACLAFTALPLTAGSSVDAETWSRFRGPNGAGVSASTALPVEFGPEKNKVWETAVPFGRSSPVIGGGRIFLTAVEDRKLTTLAIDRASGKVLWRRQLDPSHEADLYKDTDSATPTPVTDGTNVYAFFHEFGLVSYSGKGKERWRLPLGPFRNYYGIASSPVLAGDLLFLVCDQAEGSFLVAVEKDTGKERWRRNRPARLESYTTPILYPDAKRPKAVVVFGSRWIDAYALETGDNVFTVGGVGTGPVSSPVLAGDTIFANAHDHVEQGWPPFAGLAEEHDGDGDGKLSKAEVDGSWLANHFGWLDTDASGALTAEDWERLAKELVNKDWGVFAVRVRGTRGQPEMLWNYRQNVPYIPSPLIYDGVLYIVKDSVVSSLDPKTGKLLKRDRLGGSAKVFASPVAGDGKIYIGTREGEVVVLEAGAEWTVVRTNDMGGEIWATPAIADGHLYVRTSEKLYSFARASVDVAGTAARGAKADGSE